MSLALERGSEANAPLGRSVIGGLLAGLVTTLFVVPALYSLVVRDGGSDVSRPSSATPDRDGQPPDSAAEPAYMRNRLLG
jgi:hypothetical protein